MTTHRDFNADVLRSMELTLLLAKAESVHPKGSSYIILYVNSLELRPMPLPNLKINLYLRITLLMDSPVSLEYSSASRSVHSGLDSLLSENTASETCPG